jgi:hypothetical protein
MDPICFKELSLVHQAKKHSKQLTSSCVQDPSDDDPSATPLEDEPVEEKNGKPPSKIHFGPIHNYVID